MSELAIKEYVPLSHHSDMKNQFLGRKEPPSLEEIKENIKELWKVSKTCANTIGEGIDSYRMVSKDLEVKVDGLFHKIVLMIDTIS